MATSDLVKLGTDEWDQVQQLFDHFEEAWRGEGTVDLGAFLPPPGDPLRPLALEELVKSDLEIRWRRGQKVLLEDYLTRYPELAANWELVPQLLHAEYRVRQLHGDRPGLGSYRERFPTQFEQLQQLARGRETQTAGPAAQAALLHHVFGVAREREPEAAPPPTHPCPSPEVRLSGRPPPGEAGRAAQTSGGYELVEPISSGGCGEVWRARAPGGFPAAVKIVLRPISDEEAQHELKSLELMQRLSHPYLLLLEASWCQEGRLYIAMELAEGSLRDRLKACRQAGLTGIPAPELLRCLAEAAEALDYLHGEHVLHRDIKPDNILLLKGHAKVADFGLARFQESQHSVTVSGSGTPAYMAPEVFWSSRASERSDVYSLAVTYAELRLGRRPFSGSTRLEVMSNHRSGTPDLTGLPPPEQRVLLKALAKDPHQRHASCSEFVQAVAEAVNGGPEPAAPPASPPGDGRDVPGPASDNGKGVDPSCTLGSAGRDSPPGPPPSRPTPVCPPPSPARRRRFVPARWVLAGLTVAAAAGLLAAVLLVLAPWRGGSDGTQETGPGRPHDEPGPVHPFPGLSRHDFGVQVGVLGSSRPDQAGTLWLVEGQEVAFRIEVERDAYVGLWTVAPDRTVKQLFPNKWESDRLFRAGKPRTVPNIPDYLMEAVVSGGAEWVWVVASTEDWDEPQGRREGPFLLLERPELVRDVVLKPAPKRKRPAAVTEAVLRYRVSRHTEPRSL